MRVVRARLILLAAVCLLTILVVVLAKMWTATADACTLYAAANGSDASSGSASDPFASVQKLIDSLKPGETGCLKAGIYTDLDDRVTFNFGGTADGRRVTLQSAPGERATINAQLYVPEGSDFVTVRDLVLDGSRSPECVGGATCEILPSPLVNGDYAVFEYNEVTNNNRAICFHIGGSGIMSHGTAIKHNKIYGCGRIPKTGYDHGIYLNHSHEARVVSNWIYDNADQGIQLRKDADDTLIEHNVVDGNGGGIIFSGDPSTTSDLNTVSDNVITFSTDRYDVESWYPNGGMEGVGNVVYGNCIYGGKQGAIRTLNGGFEAFDNLIQDPLYAATSEDDYTVRNRLCPDVWDGTDTTAPAMAVRALPWSEARVERGEGWLRLFHGHVG